MVCRAAGSSGASRKRLAAAMLLFIGVAVAAIAAWVYHTRLATRFEPASLDRMAFPLPDKPSIAVLPFGDFSEEPNQGYIAEVEQPPVSGIIAAKSKSSVRCDGHLRPLLIAEATSCSAVTALSR